MDDQASFLKWGNGAFLFQGDVGYEIWDVGCKEVSPSHITHLTSENWFVLSEQ
jgi:hypothetical protein